MGPSGGATVRRSDTSQLGAKTEPRRAATRPAYESSTAARQKWRLFAAAAVVALRRQGRTFPRRRGLGANLVRKQRLASSRCSSERTYTAKCYAVSLIKYGVLVLIG